MSIDDSSFAYGQIAIVTDVDGYDLVHVHDSKEFAKRAIKAAPRKDAAVRSVVPTPTPAAIDVSDNDESDQELSPMIPSTAPSRVVPPRDDVSTYEIASEDDHAYVDA